MMLQGPSRSDHARERRIQRLAGRVLSAQSMAEAREHFRRMSSEISKRSSAQILRMEFVKGLR